MADHPETGPISPERLQEIAELPYGKATAELRKHDPLWGRSTGETFPWRVRCVESVRMRGYVTVDAANEEAAIAAAHALAEAGKVTCDDFVDSDGIDVEWAEPA